MLRFCVILPLILFIAACTPEERAFFGGAIAGGIIASAITDRSEEGPPPCYGLYGRRLEQCLCHHSRHGRCNRDNGPPPYYPYRSRY